MVPGVILLIDLALLAFGINFRNVLMLIDLIRDFKSSRAVNKGGEEK